MLRKLMEFAFGSGLALIIGALTTPIITRLRTTGNMGLFNMFTIIATLISLIVLFGLDQGYARFFYEENIENRKSLLFECLKLPVSILLIISILLLIFYKPISIIILEQVDFRIVVALIVYLWSCLFMTFSKLIIRMYQQTKMFSFLQVLVKVLYVIFVLGLYLFLGDNYWTVILAIVLANSITAIMGIFVKRDEWNFFKSKEYKCNISMGEILKYSIPLLFSAAIFWAFTFSDRIMLRIMLSGNELKEGLGIYAGAFSIIALLIACQSVFNIFWVPTANEKIINEPEDRDFFAKVNDYMVVLMLTGLILLIAFKGVIIKYLGPDYRNAQFIIPFLGFMPVYAMMSEVTAIGINFMKKTKYHIVIAVVAAIVNLVGNFLLVGIWNERGAAVSTGISYIVYFFLRTYYSQKFYPVKYNMRKILVVTIITTILALYSTFYTIDYVIVVLTLADLGVLTILYKNTIKEIFFYLKKQIKKLRKKSIFKIDFR